MDGEDRIVTFFNEAVARERLIDLSDEDRRLVWSIVEGPYTHHNGAAQVHAGEDARRDSSELRICSPTIWAQLTDGLMERGIETIKQTLEATDTAD